MRVYKNSAGTWCYEFRCNGRRELPFVKRRGVGIRVDWREFEQQLERDSIKRGSS
jgi:hypothetical protein